MSFSEMMSYEVKELSVGSSYGSLSDGTKPWPIPINVHVLSMDHKEQNAKNISSNIDIVQENTFDNAFGKI